jgi:hypothetical protein
MRIFMRFFINDGCLTSERMRELIHYDPATGIFTWITSRKGHHANRIAGKVTNHGYRQIGIERRYYAAHRLAWLWMTGAWPAGDIDHINLDRADNRFVNLREATDSQNQANRLALATNTSGFKGVTWHKKAEKWQAQIQVEGKVYYLGLYPTPEAAHATYAIAAEQHFGQFARMK